LKEITKLISKNQLTIRTFQTGDELSIVNLFNKQFSNLAGFVPRTVEYWTWSCLKRPDVDEKGILVVKNGEETLGYIVVGKSGSIWELCYDPHYTGKATVSMLLNWALDYCRSNGCDSVALNAYIRDNLIKEVCQELNFAQSLPDPMFLSVLDLPELICNILRAKGLNLNDETVFWFNLHNCPSWCLKSFGIKVEKNDVNILKDSVDSKISIDIEMDTFVDLLFANASITKSIITSKIRFNPFWQILKVENLLSNLQVKTPWFIPRADMG
jgi:hypothetical protein